MNSDAQSTAERCAKILWDSDKASSAMGMQLESVGPGVAVCSLVVESRHCNGHAICHGGIIFSLADSAFAFACNSYNQRAVAQHNSISYLAPGKLGTTLTATASETALAGRTGIYDVSVQDENNELIATFRGCSRSISGTLF